MAIMKSPPLGPETSVLRTRSVDWKDPNQRIKESDILPLTLITEGDLNTTRRSLN